LYAPNSEHIPFFTEVFETLHPQTELLMGDWNIVTRLSDRKPQVPLPNDALTLSDLLASHKFYDPLPLSAPHTFTHRGNGSTARLDRCLLSRESSFSTLLSSLVHFPSSHKLSDHTPVLYHAVSPHPIPKGSPFWRLNSKRIAPHTISSLTSLVSPFQLLSDKALSQSWDNIKLSIQSFFRTSNQESQNVRTESTSEPQNHFSVDPLKDQYEKRILLGRIKADKARELPSSFLSSLIDSNISSNHIPCVKTPSGNLSIDHNDITAAHRSFYASSFSPKQSSSTPLHSLVPKLPPALTSSLNTSISPPEVISSAHNTKPLSAPGLDGLPYTLYSQVPALAALLTRVINHAITTGHFPSSWSLIAFRPILKPDKDPSLPSSYRPIALICTDYKIFANILNACIRPFMHSIFPLHQTGYIPKRSTHLAALRFINILNTTTNSAPLLLDFEKAYDRVSHSWLRHTLHASNFPCNLTKLILSIHTSSIGQVIINNRLSTKFFIQSGVRQGDPLAPFLFILSLEPLLLHLESKNIHPQSHCDDIALVATKQTLPTISSSLHTYELASGALLNKSKSTILSSSITHPPFPTNTTPQRYLGLYLSKNKRFILPSHIIDQVLNKLTHIKKLPLSLAGKMTILSSYIRPILLYHLSIAPSPPHLALYIQAEKWFLSSKTTPFSQTQRINLLFNENKLLHPDFHFRLKPFEFSVNTSRTLALIRLFPPLSTLTKLPAQHLPLIALNNNPEQNTTTKHPWHAPIVGFKNSLHLLPLTLISVNNTNTPSNTGRFLLANNTHQLNALPSTNVKAHIKSQLAKAPLPLSNSQSTTFSNFNTKAKTLYSIINNLPIRPHILSFTWKLTHHSLALHIYPLCPFCKSEPPTHHHLFLPTCQILKYHYTQSDLPKNPLASLLSPPHKKIPILLSILACWSIWKYFCQLIHSPPSPNDVLSDKPLKLMFISEVERFKATNPSFKL
jgi:hypothetical protein